MVDLGGVRVAMSTDSYVVDPLFFPGGSIGHLAVHGTVNDLAVVGARPQHLSAAFVLHEGLPLEDAAPGLCGHGRGRGGRRRAAGHR